MLCKPSFLSAIATSLMILAIAPPLLAHPDQSPIQALLQTWKISQQDNTALPQTAALIYVAPRSNALGLDVKADGSPMNPYPSIAAALATKPVAGTVIQLAQGIYSTATGESFPIRLPVGVTLRGEPIVRGVNTLIRGSGKFISPTFASQNITILADDDVRIEGITITNPNSRGTAIWVESNKRVAIANNTLTNSDREGLFLTGTADAIVSENLFKKNGANGLSAVGSSTGEIRNNIFESTGFGLAIGQKSRVNVINNNILNNTDGIVISNLSAPTLRNNLIADSKRNGVVILKDRKGYPTPDLGTSINLGKNIFRNNLDKDLNNNSGVTQVAVGNELDLKKIVGNIAFIGEAPTAPISNSNITPNTINKVEITRSPQPIFNPPITPSKLSAEPSAETLPDVLIDRDPIPVVPIPFATPAPLTPAPLTNFPLAPPLAQVPIAPIPYLPPIPYNVRVAALVPRAAVDTTPYLVVIPSSDNEVLQKVQSAVPSARIIPSRFGNIIMVQGYPDRDRAEVLKTIMRSEIGLDARVVHQNTL